MGDLSALGGRGAKGAFVLGRDTMIADVVVLVALPLDIDLARDEYFPFVLVFDVLQILDINLGGDVVTVVVVVNLAASLARGDAGTFISDLYYPPVIITPTVARCHCPPHLPVPLIIEAQLLSLLNLM